MLLRRLLALLSLALACTAFAQTAPSAFDVATVKPNPNADPMQGSWSPPGRGEFKATGVSLALLVRLAYNVDDKQIANRPKWMDTALFDVNAKPDAGVALSREELRPRLQTLLAERFHLKVHRETREVAGYALVAAPHGAKLTPTDGSKFAGFRINVNPGHLQGINWTMPYLAQQITSLIGKPVADQTGIAGSYDIRVEYAPDDAADTTLPSLFTALGETLGLRLVARKVPTEVLVIDSADATPVAN